MKHPNIEDNTLSTATTDCCGSSTVTSPAPLNRGLTYHIPTMDCAGEEAEIRRTLEPIAGIRGLRFQLSQRTLTIDADADALAAALLVIAEAGFEPKLISPTTANASHSAGDGHDHELVRGTTQKLVAALALAIAAEGVGYFAPENLAWKIAGFAIAAIAIWLAGFDVYKKGFGALRRGKLNINALMTVAVTGAFFIGQWPEAAMVMALYAIAEAIEARAVDRARNAIQGLLAMAPEQASVRQGDGSWVTVAVAQIEVGSTLRVKPGERVLLRPFQS